MTQSQLRRAEEEEDVTGGDQALIKKRAKIGRQQKTRVSSRSYQKKKTASPPTTLCQHGAAPATGCNRPSLQETSHLRTIRAASHLPPAQRGAQQTPHSPETSTLPPARPPACLAHCPRGGRVTPLSETKLFKVGSPGRRRGAKRRFARFHKARQCALSRNLHVRQHNLKLLLLTQNKLNRGVDEEEEECFLILFIKEKGETHNLTAILDSIPKLPQPPPFSGWSCFILLLPVNM